MYTAVSGFAAGYVAQEQGFFKKRGIDMEFIQTMSSGNNPPALVSNSVQVAGPTMPTLLQANDSGLDLVVIASGAVYPLEADILVARQGSGIKKPADLKGKTVGVPGLGALLHFMLIRNLKQNGVDPNDVKYRRDRLSAGGRRAQERPDRRLSGAGAVHRAHPAIRRRLRSRELAEEYAGRHHHGGLRHHAQMGGGQQARPSRRLRDAMKEAVEFSKAHRPEMYAAIAKYTKLPPAVVSSLSPPNLEVDTSPQQIKFWIDLAKEQSAIKGNPDPAKIIYKP